MNITVKTEPMSKTLHNAQKKSVHLQKVIYLILI